MDGTNGTVLVTGGTGTLGSAVAARLRAAGAPTRVLSRRPGSDRVLGDLDTGEGLDAAVRGARVVVHAATRNGHDVAGTEQLVAAARREGGHLVAPPGDAGGTVTFEEFLTTRYAVQRR